MDTRDAFLVIGAGPVGLAVAKALGEVGLPYVQVEATDHVGGNWAHGVYDTAHIISSRKTTEYPDWPMPSDWPDFPSAQQMRTYYDAYADRFDLRRHLRFEHEVSSVRPDADGRWQVSFTNGRTDTFKGVLVCNGHHWAKRFPAWTSAFTGEVLHSKDYKRPDQLRGKRVLVLGGGNSGCDIASEAARVGASADWSLRRGYWFVPKTFFGTPTVELMKPWMPIRVQRALMKSLIRVSVGRYEDYGLPHPDHEMFEAHPTVSSEVFHYLQHGRLRARPDVARVDGSTVHFVDGTSSTYDLVVCATGFDVAFPFLAQGVVDVDDKVAKLLGHCMTRDHRHLYIIGTTQPRYGLGPLVRPMAEVLAQLVKIQDELTLPLGEVLWQLGERPETTHLVDPHAALRRLAVSKRLLPLLRWRAKRLDRTQRPRVTPAVQAAAK